MASRRGPDNTVRFAISGLLNSNNWANIFHAQLTTGSTITAADLQTWLIAACASYKTRMTANIVPQVAFKAGAAVLYAPGGGQVSAAATMTGNGTHGGAQETNNAGSVCISWQSSVYWRGGKPRTYIPGLATDQCANSTDLTPTAITNAQGGMAAFRTDVNALTAGTITGTTLGFISYRSGNVDRVPPIFYPVTGCTVHTRIATQRRRLGKWKV